MDTRIARPTYAALPDIDMRRAGVMTIRELNMAYIAGRISAAQYDAAVRKIKPEGK